MARARSQTPDGLAPIFDFGELEALEEAVHITVARAAAKPEDAAWDPWDPWGLQATDGKDARQRHSRGAERHGDVEEPLPAVEPMVAEEEHVEKEQPAGVVQEQPVAAVEEQPVADEEPFPAVEEPVPAEEPLAEVEPVVAEEEHIKEEQPVGAVEEQPVAAVEEQPVADEEPLSAVEEPVPAEEPLPAVEPTLAKEQPMLEEHPMQEELPAAAEEQPELADEQPLAEVEEQLVAALEEQPAAGEEPLAAVEELVQEEEQHRRHQDGHSWEPSGEWYIVTIATYVNIFPVPDDRSGPILGRLGRRETALLFEWDDSATWRKCRVGATVGVNGREGCWPQYGWVKVLTWKYGPLLVPLGESQQLHRLCQGDSSGVLRSVLEDMCEENVQKHVPGMLQEKRQSRQEALRTAMRVKMPGARAPLRVSDGRLVLGSTPRPPGPVPHFTRALVMGAHHTCSTALTRELEAQFFVKVENNYDTVLPEARPPNHKHLVLKSPPEPQDALIICLVKEPCFWLQSLTRHGATYAIHALQELPQGGYVDLERHVGAMDDRSQEEWLDAILGPVEFLGDLYPQVGALRVWEATVRSYFDPKAYPLWRTAVVRCEDFLFSFEAVMSALSQLGLERRPNPPPPDGRKAKGGIIHYRARNREEALLWYGGHARHHDNEHQQSLPTGEPENRWVGLENRHVDAVFRTLGDLILGPLSYGPHAVRSWSSRPPCLYIAGTWAQFQPQSMAWDGLHFVHSTRVGKDGESFQLLLEGSWSDVYYPSVADGCPHVEYKIMGPDAQGHGKNWTIGRHRLDPVQPNNFCRISVEVDPCGVPIRIEWEPTVMPA